MAAEETLTLVSAVTLTAAGTEVVPASCTAAVFTNIGTRIAYIGNGAAVTPADGMALMPGERVTLVVAAAASVAVAPDSASTLPDFGVNIAFGT